MKRFPALFQFQPLAFSLQPFPRHWLAGVLAKEQPALFRDLPDSYKVGHPLPCRPVAAVCDRRSRSNFKARRSQSAATTAKLHFVHGCELLAV